MEFWPGNQGQSPLYSTFTLPGRNCTQIYHDRHQAARNPLYYGERQEQRREPSYWTLPGARAASQDYATWMEQEPVGPSSLHFPFMLDRHPQHHQDVGAYQPLEGERRDREWAQRASREYERGFPREGWPRRWETCTPARYGRDASAKRNDSSYRELEAWAARYSHSLQRRRRIEAELRGASRGPAESSGAPESDVRGGTTRLQQVVHPGLCDRAGRQQAQPLQTAAADTGHHCYQRRTFSQPPGYVAPPPYDTPQKSSSVSPQGDTSWEQECQKQTYWSHPAPKKLDFAGDHRTRRTEGFTKADANQHDFRSQLSKPGADSLQGSGSGHVPRPHVQFEGMLSLQQSPILPTVQNKAPEPSSKIIEGRKFKLNKKAGGVTIFCLVSRIADATEAAASPVGAPQANLRSSEGGDAPQGAVSQTQKLADEVDCSEPVLPESQSESSSDAQGEAATCSKTEKPETDAEEERAKDADSTAGMHSGKSVRYPLWREPSFPVRSEHVVSPTSGEGESGVLCNKEAPAEVRPEDAEGEGGGEEGLLSADAACVLVKMEQIPSPKKEHVHYFDAAAHLEDGGDVQSASSQACVEANGQSSQDGNTDHDAKLELLLNTEKPETQPDSDVHDEEEPEQRAASVPRTCSSADDREPFAVRAERILGISLTESVAEQQPEDAPSLQTEAERPSTAEVTDGDASAEDTAEQEHRQNQLELDQSVESVEAKDQVDDKGGQGSSESEEDGSTTGRPDTHAKAPEENDTHQTKAESGENAYERGERESSTDEDNTSSPLLSPSTDGPSPTLDCQSPDVLPPPGPSTSNLEPISETPESECSDLELMAPITAPADVSSALSPSQQLASPPPQDPQSTSHGSESQSHLVSSVLDLDEDDKTSQVTNTEMSEEFEDVPKDEAEEVVSQQRDEVREQAELNGGGEMSLDDEQRAEEEEVLVDSGVEETETPAEVSQKLDQDEDNVYTEESPGSVEQLCEDPEEEHTEDIQMLELDEEPNIIHAGLQPAGTYADDAEPLKEAETGLLEEKTSRENNTQLTHSQEMIIFQLCDSDNTSIIKESGDEHSGGATGEPTSLPGQERDKGMSSELHTDTENQLELEPSNSPPPPPPPSPPPPGFELLPTSELPAPSQAPPGSGSEVVPLGKMGPEAAVTMETDISPLHLVSCEESQELSSSSDSLPGLPMSASPPPPPEGNEGVAPDSSLSEEPQYPRSLWDAVNRIRKHTAPDSENEEEELGEVWDPESVGEDSAGPRGAQDTTETKEALADQSVKDAEDLEEGPLTPSSTSSTSSHSAGEMLTDEEEDNEDTASQTGTEVRTLKDEELRTAAGEQSCVAEDEDEEQGHQ